MELVLSTAYMPSIYYFALINASDCIIIDLGEHYKKQNHRNRFEIQGPNGVLKRSVPLKKWSNNTPVKQIEISYDEDWQNLHWRSLESCYRSSPYFEYYESKLHELVFKKHSHLWELNRDILVQMMDILDLSTEIKFEQTYVDDVAGLKDMRALKRDDGLEFPTYIQVFNDRHPFHRNLSILDLICNEGPNAINLLPVISNDE